MIYLNIEYKVKLYKNSRNGESPVEDVLNNPKIYE